MPQTINTLGEHVVTKLDREKQEVRARRIGQAVQCMKRFFTGRPYYKPYPDPKDVTKLSRVIPQEVLISPTNIDIVVDTNDFNAAMEVVHDEVAKHKQSGKTFAFSGFLDDKKESELYLRLTQDFRRLEIPYHFQGGIVLLYLWLCEGIEYS